jgi:biofilm PGA synthesis N-glycosyltransferase PgaC
MSIRRIFLPGFVLFCELLLILFFIPSFVAWICALIGAATALYFLIMAIRVQRSKSTQKSSIGLGMFSVFSIAAPVLFGFIAFQYGSFPPILTVLFTALMIDFFTNFLSLPLCLYHKYLEDKFNQKEVTHWPPVTVIVPAHNEEKVIEKCIESLIEVDYPKKEIIVVDDGSVDRTYEIARRYEKYGIKVLHRSTAGGKSMAMNTAMLIAKGEIIMTCDADSLIGRNAFKMIVRRFQNPEVNAVAGNVKVLNRTNLVTNCQALEYIVCENVQRRVFDVFGVVPVVPGPLGAFRKKSLNEIGFYDHDTLTEDLDITIKILKTGNVVLALSNAYVYTEAPVTWGDLYKQRLRWSRGTFQGLLKHRDVFQNAKYGFLHDITFPYVLLSMVFIPSASMVSIVSLIISLMSGFMPQLFSIMIGFLLLEATYSYLAIQMDNEDMKLIIYSPLFVVGYKELYNFIKLKSVYDIITKKEMKWDSIRRIGEIKR